MSIRIVDCVGFQSEGGRDGWQKLHSDQRRASLQKPAVFGAREIVVSLEIVVMLSMLSMVRLNGQAKSSETNGTGKPIVNLISSGTISDALMVRDGSMRRGSAVLFSQSGLFAPNAVGKTISVQGAGPDGAQLTTTISRFIDTRHVMLSKLADKDTVSGAIDEGGLTLMRQGTNGYYAGQYETRTQGTGSGARISISANGRAIGPSPTPTVVNPGFGYSVGDKVYPLVPGSDGAAYFQVTKVDGAGVIWGTDNYSAFRTAISAAAGKHLIIPAGNYLINTAQGKKAIQVSSDTQVDMDSKGTLYWVGVQNASESSNGWALFNLDSGTKNVILDGIHCVGENLVGLTFVMNNPGCILLGTGVDHIWIRNGNFSNSFGHAIEGQSTVGNDVLIVGNTFSHNNDTGVNVNAAHTTIAHNTFINDAGIEAAGAQSHYDNNTLINPVGGPTAIAAGGITAGGPYQGGTVIGNQIINPASTSALAALSGFSRGFISNNTVQGYTGSQFCIEDVYTGYVHADYNTFANNSCSGTGKATFYFNAVKGATLHTNIENGMPQFGVLSYGSTEFESLDNVLIGRSYDIFLANSSSGRFRDKLAHNTKFLRDGSRTSPDSKFELRR